MLVCYVLVALVACAAGAVPEGYVLAAHSLMMPGGVLLEGHSLSQCAGACTNNTNCIAFDTDGKRCYLHTQAAPPSIADGMSLYLRQTGKSCTADVGCPVPAAEGTLCGKTCPAGSTRSGPYVCMGGEWAEPTCNTACGSCGEHQYCLQYTGFTYCAETCFQNGPCGEDEKCTLQSEVCVSRGCRSHIMCRAASAPAPTEQCCMDSTPTCMACAAGKSVDEYCKTAPCSCTVVGGVVELGMDNFTRVGVARDVARMAGVPQGSVAVVQRAGADSGIAWISSFVATPGTWLEMTVCGNTSVDRLFDRCEAPLQCSTLYRYDKLACDSGMATKGSCAGSSVAIPLEASDAPSCNTACNKMGKAGCCQWKAGKCSFNVAQYDTLLFDSSVANSSYCLPQGMSNCNADDDCCPGYQCKVSPATTPYAVANHVRTCRNLNKQGPSKKDGCN